MTMTDLHKLLQDKFPSAVLIPSLFGIGIDNYKDLSKETRLSMLELLQNRRDITNGMGGDRVLNGKTVHTIFHATNTIVGDDIESIEEQIRGFFGEELISTWVDDKNKELSDLCEEIDEWIDNEGFRIRSRKFSKFSTLVLFSHPEYGAFIRISGQPDSYYFIKSKIQIES